MRRFGRVSATLPRVACAVCAACLTASAALAEGPPRGLTLGEALTLVSRSPARKAARWRTLAARRAVDASGGLPPTELGLATSSRTARLSPTLRVPLPIFGTLGAEQDVAGAELQVARDQEQSDELGLLREAERSFIALAHAEARAELTAQAAARKRGLAQSSAARFEAGDAPRAESVAAEAEARRAAAAAKADRSAVLAVSAHLAGVLGLDPSQALHAKGGIPASDAPPPLSSLLARTGEHPAVQVATASAAAAAKVTDQARSTRWPELALELGADIDDPTLPGTDLHAGIGVALPLFAGTSGHVARARAEHQAALADEAAVVAAVRAEIVRAYRDFEAARERERALREDVVPVEREAATMTRSAYEEGLVGLVSVLEAERRLSDAELEALDAAAETALARADLAWSTGGSM